MIGHYEARPVWCCMLRGICALRSAALTSGTKFPTCAPHIGCGAERVRVSATIMMMMERFYISACTCVRISHRCIHVDAYTCSHSEIDAHTCVHTHALLTYIAWGCQAKIEETEQGRGEYETEFVERALKKAVSASFALRAFLRQQCAAKAVEHCRVWLLNKRLQSVKRS